MGRLKRHEISGSLFIGFSSIRQTWYSAAAFCESIGSHLVELNTGAEYQFIQNKSNNNSEFSLMYFYVVLRFTVRTISWVDGPWIGMIRLFGDSRWMLPSTHGQSDENGLNNRMFVVMY